MKSKTKNLPVPAKPIEPEVVQPLGKIEEPDYTKPAERINFHIGMGQHHGRLALAHILIAGQELDKQKQMLGYGGWNVWCETELSISRLTADRYIKFFYKVIMEKRRAAEIPFDRRLTNKELSAATVGMDGKTATRAMVDLGIIKRADWGGKREGAGNKPKGEDIAAEIAAAAQAEPLVWASAKGALDTLVQLDAERDFLHRLTDEHLAAVSNLLTDLSKKAAEALTRRMAT